MTASTDPGSRWPARPTTEPILREFAYPQDYFGVIELWRRSGPGVNVGRSDTAQEIEKKLSRDPDLFLVAEIEQQIVGTIIGGFDGRRGIMYHLAVAEPFRNRGIGEQLMQELENRLRAKGCLRCYLMVVEGNPEVVDFYLKRGFSHLPVHTLAKDLQ